MIFIEAKKIVLQNKKNANYEIAFLKNESFYFKKYLKIKFMNL